MNSAMTTPKLDLYTEHIVTTRVMQLNDRKLGAVEVECKGFIVADVGNPGAKYNASNHMHELKFVEKVEAHHEKMCDAISTEQHWIVARKNEGTTPVSQLAKEGYHVSDPCTPTSPAFPMLIPPPVERILEITSERIIASDKFQESNLESTNKSIELDSGGDDTSAIEPDPQGEHCEQEEASDAPMASEAIVASDATVVPEAPMPYVATVAYEESIASSLVGTDDKTISDTLGPMEADDEEVLDAEDDQEDDQEGCAVLVESTLSPFTPSTVDTDTTEQAQSYNKSKRVRVIFSRVNKSILTRANTYDELIDEIETKARQMDITLSRNRYWLGNCHNQSEEKEWFDNLSSEWNITHTVILFFQTQQTASKIAFEAYSPTESTKLTALQPEENTSQKRRRTAAHSAITNMKRACEIMDSNDESDCDDLSEVLVDEHEASTSGVTKKGITQNKLNIVVNGLGTLKRDKVMRLIMAVVEDLGMEDMYMMHVQPGGAQKPSYKYGDDVIIFPNACAMIAHISKTAGLDVIEELEDDPQKLFSQNVMKLPLNFFNK